MLTIFGVKHKLTICLLCARSYSYTVFSRQHMRSRLKGIAIALRGLSLVVVVCGCFLAALAPFLCAENRTLSLSLSIHSRIMTTRPSASASRFSFSHTKRHVSTSEPMPNTNPTTRLRVYRVMLPMLIEFAGEAPRLLCSAVCKRLRELAPAARPDGARRRANATSNGEIFISE